MKKNFNTQIRKIIFDFCDQIKIYEDDDYASFFENYYYALDYIDHDYVSLFKTYVTMILFLDAYKIYSFKNKEGILNDDEMELFEILTSYEDFEDIEASIYADPMFFQKLIESTYHFYQMSGLGKMNIIHSLSQEENDYLTDLCPAHKEDLKKYKKQITIKDLLKSYQAQKKYQEKKLDCYSSQSILYQIARFIQNLCKNDYDQASILLYDIGRSDYVICSNFVPLSEKNDLFHEHYFFYEESDAEDILWRLEKDENFLLEALYHMTGLYIEGNLDENTFSKDNFDLSQEKVYTKKFEEKKEL